MRNILILPVDDRPCHNDLIIDACKYIDDITINMVPKPMLGHFTHGGDTHDIAHYLKKHASEADTLIVSIDGLLYGGLVQSRSMNPDASLYDYETLLDTLVEIKKENPELKILAYSVIVRLTTTVTDSSRLQVWEDIFKYSQLAHQVQLDPSYQNEFDVVKNRIPEADLYDYLNARQRNHTFNKRCVELVEQNVIDYLALVQEDTHEYGLHVAEQKILQDLIATKNLNDSIIIKNGTDEMIALLLARDLNKNTKRFSLDTQFLDKDYVAVFEDKPALRNIHDSLSVANLTPSTSMDEDVIMIALPATGETTDLCFQTKPEAVQLTDAQRDVYARYKNQHFALLDVQFGNGGDVRTLEKLLEVLPSDNLIGYSGWNTGSNSIGTLVLDLVIALYYQPNKVYIQSRIVDDAIYQGDIRPIINQRMKEKGLDTWAENYDDSINEELTALLNVAIKMYPFLNGLEVEATFPWGRSFEVLLKTRGE